MENQLRVYDYSWRDVMDPHRGGNDPDTHERRIKAKCKYCEHDAMEITPSTGRFKCWRCGAHGYMMEDHEAWLRLQKQYTDFFRQEHIRPPHEPGVKRSLGASALSGGASASAGTGASAKEALPDAVIADYMPLPESDLRTIEDIYLGDVPNERQQAVRLWLAEQQLPLEVAQQMHLGVAVRFLKTKHDDEPKKHVCVAFRNLIEGYCCNVKFRAVTCHMHTERVDGQTVTVKEFEKGFDQLSSFTPCAPYHVEVLWDAPRTIYYTEGEKDALTLAMLGFTSVMSAASGAQTQMEKSFKAFEHLLEPVEEVVIVGDQDVPGRAMVRQAVAYFSAKRVRVAQWDQRRLGKDISDVYQRFGAEVARQLVLSAEMIAPEGVEDFTSAESLQEALRCARGEFDPGFDLGIGPRTNEHLRLSLSQAGLMIVTGTPGTGKTDFLNFLTMSVVNVLRCHVCFCSFETPNKCRHAGDLAQIWGGDSLLADLTEADAMGFVRTVTSHLTHVSFPRGGATPEAILQRANAVLNVHPDLRFLLVDPYLYVEMQEGREVTETSAIKLMLRTFQEWAYRHHVWVLIVAHPRKLQKTEGDMELEEVDMYTIAGSANWANMADMVCSLRRVLNKEQRMDYTRLSVLKVRDQKMCTPGDVFYLRNWCGRYAECASEEEAKRGRAEQTEFAAWKLDDPAGEALAEGLDAF